MMVRAHFSALDRLPDLDDEAPPNALTLQHGAEETRPVAEDDMPDEPLAPLDAVQRLLGLNELGQQDDGQPLPNELLQRAGAALRSRSRRDAREVIEAGLILREIKARTGHGQFEPWLAQFDIKPRAAQRSMRIADLFSDKYARVTHLSERQLGILAQENFAELRLEVLESGGDPPVLAAIHARIQQRQEELRRSAELEHSDTLATATDLLVAGLQPERLQKLAACLRGISSAELGRALRARIATEVAS